MDAKRLTRFGLLIALAFILSYIETFLPLMPYPGMKVGLANIVIIAALYELGGRDAFVLSMVRILLVSLALSGFAPMLYSLGGGVLSLLVMILLKKTGKFSIVGVSVAGGVCHNIGQIGVAMLIFDKSMLVNLPMLMISGAVTGIAIGVAGAEVTKRIHKFLR